MEMKVRMDVRAVMPWHVPMMVFEPVSSYFDGRLRSVRTFIGDSANESNPGFVCLHISDQSIY
jgi:hypothetical protein